MGKRNRRSPSQIARDRRRIADAYLRGCLQADIAIELGLSEATISRDLQVLHGEWLKSGLIDYNRAKAQELAKVDALEREYWGAWERSKGKAIRMRGQKKVNGQTIVNTTEADNRDGDSRFLAGVQWCIERRCKILGIDAPGKYDVRVDDLEGAIERELARMASGRATTVFDVSEESRNK